MPAFRLTLMAGTGQHAMRQRGRRTFRYHFARCGIWADPRFDAGSNFNLAAYSLAFSTRSSNDARQKIFAIGSARAFLPCTHDYARSIFRGAQRKNTITDAAINRRFGVAL